MGVYYQVNPKKKRNFFNSFSVNTNLIILNLVFYFGISFYILFARFSSVDQILSFYNYFALKPLNVLQGKYLWTFLTSMFMHGGFFHLFANMLSLLFIGGLVEKILGRKRYFWFYLFSGLFSGLFFVIIIFLIGTDLNTFELELKGLYLGL